MKTTIIIGVIMFFLTISNSHKKANWENCCPNDDKKVSFVSLKDSIQKRITVLDKKIAVAQKRLNIKPQKAKLKTKK